MTRYLREPLLHFLVLGAVLFAIDRSRATEEVAPVVVTDAFVEGLRRESLRSSGREAEDDDALVRAFLREEALVREANALGLAEGDVIVRRRLKQKMEFLLRSTAEVPPPTDAQLLAFLRAHPGRYRRPPRVTFRHVFFDRGRRDDAVADATEALARLREGADPTTLGDPFLRGYRFSEADARRIERELGGSMAEAVDDAPLDVWTGPVEGTLGVHLVSVEARRPSEEPALSEVHARVASDWEDARRDEALEEEVRRLVDALPVERSAR
ncbi:MAG: peptidyl-prolyl cis-trans isomerase [Sandaracinus sp.]|nr:peptidyl-prolyl cis-trans isomerase [Sandaracinus sp.]MCB9615651.1 peptidyl-prolyl cis-trans isomerase [Sandaracinus sp.]MCB9618740.1 peptidyl-prolyl cis-trans isomerase [Sandaracinus sp.]MCB9636327.1 peptidyl-prolyl cis-trans isomerase [Sandaracinus sp.]